MAVAATAASHLAIPDHSQWRDSRSLAGPDIRLVVVAHHGNYADLAGRLGIRSDRAKSDYTAGDHRTDPGMMSHCCCRDGSVGDSRVRRSSSTAGETRVGRVDAPRMTAMVAHVCLRNTTHDSFRPSE